MKKILLIAAVAGLAFASCKKERKCECTQTTTSSGGTVTVYPTETVTFKKIKKGEAKDMCASYTSETTYVSPVAGSGGKSEWKCELK